MPEIRIRAAEPGDAEAIAQIMNCPGVVAGTLQMPYTSVEEHRRRVVEARPGSYRLVAELDGRIVGMAGISVEQVPRRRHIGKIGMGVHDAFQSQGVGNALMAALVDLADNWLGLHRIELEVYTDNAAAIHLYEKHGFVIEGTLRDFALRAGTYTDAYAMARIREPATS